MSYSALVAGATGLIGRQLVNLLELHPDYEKILVLSRGNHPRQWQDQAKIEIVISDFSDLESSLSNHAADHVFCALGSTTRKTPDKQRYYQIDVEYPLAIAQIGLKQGARSYNLVSAHGANAKSKNHYLHMKGELESQLSNLGYGSLNIARPGMLLGTRQESRPLESMGQVVARYLPGNYKAILGQDVAAALITAATGNASGKQILSSAEMQGAAHQLLSRLNLATARA